MDRVHTPIQAVSTRAASFQDSRPRPTQSHSWSFLKQTNLFSVPSAHAARACARRDTNSYLRHVATDHITTLPQWERDLIARVTGDFFTDSPFQMQRRNVKSSSCSPPRYSAVLTERTNQNGNAFLRHPPVLSWYQHRHLNPSDSKQHARTPIGTAILAPVAGSHLPR
jgi:hypothetical protein